MRKLGIPRSLYREILQKHGEGLSSTAICAWLKAARGITVSHRPVNDLIARDRAARKPQARRRARQDLSSSLTADLHRLEGFWTELTALQQEAAAIEAANGKSSPLLTIELLELQLGLLETKRRLLSERARVMGLTNTRQEDIGSLIGRVLH